MNTCRKKNSSKHQIFLWRASKVEETDFFICLVTDCVTNLLQKTLGEEHARH
ncbi:hypothetical protein ACHAW6_001609 [Cyclotella cf. meneghiniana]